MKRTWSFHDAGRFVGITFTGDDRALAANIPPGLGAVEGVHDPENRRFDLASNQVVDYIPPSPSADHIWNAATKRWELSPEAVASAERRDRAMALIKELELKKIRPLCELALDASNATARAALVTVEADLVTLRKDL